MLPRKSAGRVEFLTALLPKPYEYRSTLRLMHIAYTVESLTEEIGRIVVERQELRAAGAEPAVLEENRARLAAAQSALSRLLIERHLPAAETA
jgi:hypothetical protein